MNMDRKAFFFFYVYSVFDYCLANMNWTELHLQESLSSHADTAFIFSTDYLANKCAEVKLLKNDQWLWNKKKNHDEMQNNGSVTM